MWALIDSIQTVIPALSLLMAGNRDSPLLDCASLPFYLLSGSIVLAEIFPVYLGFIYIILGHTALHLVTIPRNCLFQWVDTARPGWFFIPSERDPPPVATRLHRRDIMCQCPARVLDPKPWAGFVKELAAQWHLPRLILNHLTRVKSRAFLNAAPRVPGAGEGPTLWSCFRTAAVCCARWLDVGSRYTGMRFQNTHLCQELASWGQVVFSVEHPFDAVDPLTVQELVSSVAKAPSMRLHRVRALSHAADLPAAWSMAERRRARQEELQFRVADVAFALNRISARPGPFDAVSLSLFSPAMLDLSRLALMGHSFGGATAVATAVSDALVPLAAQDVHVRAVVSLDGWAWPLSSQMVSDCAEYVPLQAEFPSTLGCFLRGMTGTPTRWAVARSQALLNRIVRSFLIDTLSSGPTRKHPRGTPAECAGISRTLVQEWAALDPGHFRLLGEPFRASPPPSTAQPKTERLRAVVLCAFPFFGGCRLICCKIPEHSLVVRSIGMGGIQRTQRVGADGVCGPRQEKVARVRVGECLEDDGCMHVRVV
ncbi:hypothetical protein PAPYR_13251 [Paratrimastix pyriformis]|uniref:1-alkyl-2-acetylglycerophosphocholine esterase n=1 Tax=Paratrimastix pyriformis TaxID=342808 RepID=A0ABQ8U0I5_9EUKA|nr:hypothetical protein PAPYR_13251 [Paratrimastix pyriformis]